MALCKSAVLCQNTHLHAFLILRVNYMLLEIEIVTRLVYWGQEKLFEEKNQR